MTIERRVKLFRIGRDQAVRIARAFELPGADAIMRQDGARLIIEPAAPVSLIDLLAKLGPVEEDFDPITDPDPARLAPAGRRSLAPILKRRPTCRSSFQD